MHNNHPLISKNHSPIINIILWSKKPSSDCINLLLMSKASLWSDWISSDAILQVGGRKSWPFFILFPPRCHSSDRDFAISYRSAFMPPFIPLITFVDAISLSHLKRCRYHNAFLSQASLYHYSQFYHKTHGFSYIPLYHKISAFPQFHVFYRKSYIIAIS